MEQIMEYAAKETPWKQIPVEMWLDLLRSGEPTGAAPAAGLMWGPCGPEA